MTDAMLDDLYNDKDAQRYQNEAAPKRFVTSGPGSYLLEVVCIKMLLSKKTENYGTKIFVVEMRVIEASPGLDENNRTQPATLSVGDTFGHVRALVGRMPQKDALELCGAIVRLPPCLLIPAGFPQAGKVLPIVTLSFPDKLSKDDGARYKGRKLFCDITPSKGKEGSRHEGKVFFNPLWSPATEDGGRTSYPSFVSLNAKSDMTQAILDYYGDPNGALVEDDDVPF